MYIVPNTTIYILNNIPLNKSYEHTVYYPDKDAQAQAFMAYKKYTLTDYSYQRSQLGTIRVALKYEQLIDCNYLMFKNTNFENKWFYAFITGIGYVSNDVTDVYYDLDVMQTWCYDYEFMPTFVDRQHSKDDVLYANTQPEGLELGADYNRQVKLTFETCSKGNDQEYLILATTSPEGNHPRAGVADGVIFSLYHYQGKAQDVLSKLNAFINNGLESNIVSIYTCPDHLALTKNYTRGNTMGSEYTPRNKKLLCYPFSFITVTNHLGEEMELHYENFRARDNKLPDKDYNYYFSCFTRILPVPQSNLTPDNYLKWYGTDTGGSLIFEKISYNVYPIGAFSGDTFKVWLAQNKNTYSASLNAIGNTYDTNMAIAENNYTMAGLNAANARTNQHLQANSALTQAENSNRASLAIHNAQSNQALYNGVSNIVGKAVDAVGAGLKGDVAGFVGNTFGVFSETTQTSLNQNIYNAQANQINTQLLNSQIGANASEAISVNTFQTAMKNATLAQTNAQLSALNAYQNATAQLMAKKQDIQHQPSNLHGSLMNDTWNAEFNLMGFTVYEKYIKVEYAKRIDAYFDKYGYAQRSMYVPERQNRNHWSYLKTVGCNIKGNINNTDLVTIKTIYDNGITTWNNLEEVGHYELDNRVK
nr:MAG TPA: Major tail protein [Caudoviricetes sp.]